MDVVSSSAVFPEVDSLVLCTVTSIQYHSVFVSLDEFGGRSGMIHISEISPGRVKNLREFVTEGKKIVCKVLRVDTEKGHVDLSLRRVSESQRRAKAEGIRQEKLSMNLSQQAALQAGVSSESVWSELVKASEGYESVFSLFEDVVAGNALFEEVGISQKVAGVLDFLVKQRLKPPVIEVGGKVSVSSFDPDGVGILREGLGLLVSRFGDDSVHSLGSGKFSVKVRGTDYKIAEKLLREGVDEVLSFFKKRKASASFEKV